MQANAFKAVNLDNKSVQRILWAAQEMWTRDGYHGVSLKDIAAAAGVAKSLVHYHFESKEHLLIALQADWCKRTARAIRERVSARPPSVEAASAALDQVWDAMVATRAQFPFAIELWRQSVSNPSVRTRLRTFDEELCQLYAEGLTSALGPLVSQLAVPVDRAAALIQTILDGISLRLFIEDDLIAVYRVFEDAKFMLLAALLPPSRSPDRRSGGRS